MQKVSPFYFPCLHSHSSPHSGSFEGNVIAVIFRCLPFPHGLCPRTWRFPGTWQVRDLPLALDTSQWWSVEGLQLSASRPPMEAGNLLLRSGLPADTPPSCPLEGSALPWGTELCKGPPFRFQVRGQEGWRGECLFLTLLLALSLSRPRS